jgi:hypothetical protein
MRVRSRSSLAHRSPVDDPREGLPIGNGTMGTLVWTTPDAVRLQINRCDVFSTDKRHTGPGAPPLTHVGEHADYCGGCAAIAILPGGEPFRGSRHFELGLSLEDAEVWLSGNDVRARCFVCATSDILALELDDQRAQAQPMCLALSMWRSPEVITGTHRARYRFQEEGGRAAVLQEFDEGGYHCRSAVAVSMPGCPVAIEQDGDSRLTLAVPARRGRSLILISSAASWSRDDPVVDRAFALLDQASDSLAYDALREPHVSWWRGFWARTNLHISSTDGTGELMARARDLHLYYMAASSRGALPPKWNGSVFLTTGDKRDWGSQYWVWTMEMLYWPLYAADAVDLTEPYWRMYLEQLPDCERAACQRWGVEGAFYPETTTYDGPVVLPEDIAFEVQDVLAGRKLKDQLTERARALCQFESHLDTLLYEQDRGAIGRYSWISHLVSSGCELAAQAWWRYRYTGDEQWLREAYPLLRGTVEFYRHFAQKGGDGLYHTHGTNAHEDFWGATDSIMDLAAMRGTLPLAIRAAEILGLDAGLRESWHSFLDKLAPYPMGSDARAMALTGSALADDVWAAGHLGDVDGQHNPEDVWLTPVFPFEDWTLETQDPAADAVVHKLVELAPRHAAVLAGQSLNTAIRSPIVAVRTGRGENLPAVLAAYYAAFSPLLNGMSLFEGQAAASIEHLGLITVTLQEALLQSVAPHPGQSEAVRVFPAWPVAWDAEFRLLARGGFVVSSSIQHGEVQFVEVESRLGEPFRLRNPWQTACVCQEDGRSPYTLSGNLLCFETQCGRRYRLWTAGPPQSERE